MGINGISPPRSSPDGLFSLAMVGADGGFVACGELLLCSCLRCGEDSTTPFGPLFLGRPCHWAAHARKHIHTLSLSLSRQMLLDITKKPSSYVSFRAQLSIMQGIEHLLAKSPRYGHSWTAYGATVYRQLAIDSVVFAPVQMVYFFSIVQMFSELS